MTARLDHQTWAEDGRRCGWELPPPAPRVLRLPVIRYIRCMWLSWKIARHYAFFAELGMVSSGYDEWVLYAISRGWI